MRHLCLIFTDYNLRSREFTWLNQTRWARGMVRDVSFSSVYWRSLQVSTRWDSWMCAAFSSHHHTVSGKVVMPINSLSIMCILLPGFYGEVSTTGWDSIDAWRQQSEFTNSELSSILKTRVLTVVMTYLLDSQIT